MFYSLAFYLRLVLFFPVLLFHVLTHPALSGSNLFGSQTLLRRLHRAPFVHTAEKQRTTGLDTEWADYKRTDNEQSQE